MGLTVLLPLPAGGPIGAEAGAGELAGWGAAGALAGEIAAGALAGERIVGALAGERGAGALAGESAEGAAAGPDGPFPVTNDPAGMVTSLIARPTSAHSEQQVAVCAPGQRGKNLCDWLPTARGSCPVKGHAG